MKSSSSWRLETPLAKAAWAARVLFFAALGVPLLLRLVKLPDLRSWLEPRREAPPLTDPAAVQTLVRRVDRLRTLGRPVVRSGCLTRGLTLYYVLRRAGADVSLRFGMGKAEDEIAGHCWLVFAGEPLAEKRDPRLLYVETYSISRLGTPDRPAVTAAAEAR
ncbi:MAG TPA: lasso peptide biosynthesis B2 protein [Thermoanaerobaculia bacterium]|nr:lasso peptide biosynthesis B2 protein [Thermoanaerobaculia bacterium]